MSLWGTITAGLGMASDAWNSEPEVNTPACRVCDSYFSITVRRHRCRACLENVCGTCSQDTADLDGDGLRHRVCSDCFEKMDRSGLIGQAQSRSRAAPQKSKFKLTLKGLRFGPSSRQRGNSGHSARESRESIICDFIVGDKLINSLRLTPEKMSLSFEFRADIYSPIESFVVVTASDATRAKGLELAHCRIPLTPCIHSDESVDLCQMLISKDRTFPIELSTRLELLSLQPREVEARPALRLEIPMLFGRTSVPISFTPGDELFTVDLFPPSSCLFFKLFHLVEEGPGSGVCVIPSGESVVDIIDDCWVHSSAAAMVCGVLLLTSHRLLFIEYASSAGMRSTAEAVGGPMYFDRLAMSSSVFFIPIASTADVIIRRFIQKYYHGLEIVCKDGINYIFRFRREAHNEMTLLEKFRRIKLEMLWRREEDAFAVAHDMMNSDAFDEVPPAPLEDSPGPLLTERSEDDVFVYVGTDGRDFRDQGHPHSRRSSATSDDFIMSSALPNGAADLNVDEHLLNTDVASIRKEYKRLLCTEIDGQEVHSLTTELLSKTWRVSEVNKYYAVCPTYPPLLVVPASLSDEHLIKASRERSSFRLPAMTWVHPTNGASLTRSSQPIVGINVTACPNDEQLLMNIRHSAVSFRDSLKLSVEIVSTGESCVGTPVALTGDPTCTELIDGSIILETSSRLDVVNGDIGEDSCAIRNRSCSDDSPFPCVESALPRESPFQRLDTSATRSYSADNPSVTAAALRNISVDESPNSRDGSPLTPSAVSSAAERSAATSATSGPPPPGADATLTKIGGLMQGFRGTQSVMLRDAGYHKAKYQLHKKMDTKGVLTFQRRTKLRVIDCRPLLNAKGNVLMGKGHEVIDRLGGSRCTSVEFANIANIHGVRESYAALRRACFAASQCGSTNGLTLNWNLVLHESKWMQHLSSILHASLCTAVNLQNGDPVLVHCSDGWDRTSQVSALAQLLIDPYYRTIEGFFVLLNKDFVWFGHRFRSRSGCEDMTEQSPVFLQFMDCVWQIWRQFPWEFEFSEKLLLLMLYTQSSRYTSDFIHESFKEKMESLYGKLCESKHPSSDSGLNVSYMSIFDHVRLHLSLYKNPVYKNGLHDAVHSAENNASKAIPSEDIGTQAADDSSSDCGSTVISEEDDRFIDNSVSISSLNQTTASVPELISTAIKSDLPNESTTGSLVTRASFSESICFPRLAAIKPKSSGGADGPRDEFVDNEDVSEDPLEAIEKGALDKKQIADKAHTVSGGHALLSVGWAAEQQGGPVFRKAEDTSASASMDTGSAHSAAHAAAVREHLPVSPPPREVRLLFPATAVPSLALWEAAHMLPGIPFSHSIAGNSVALEKGLKEALSAEKIKVSILEQQLKDVTALLRRQTDRVQDLEYELFREKIEPVDADTVFVNSCDVPDELEPGEDSEGWVWNSISQHPAVVATKNAIRTSAGTLSVKKI